MIRLLYTLVFGVVLSSCSDYSNQEIYQISVGESIDIYYFTNSCCYGCIANERHLKHVQKTDDKIIDNGPDDCAGCDYVGAFTFEGQSAGIDTVELKIVTANMECNNRNIESSKFIIKVYE